MMSKNIAENVTLKKNNTQALKLDDYMWTIM